MKGLWQKGQIPWKEVWKRYQAIFLVIAVGCVLMLMPSGSKQEVEIQENAQKEFLLDEFEERLANTLSCIEGAGEVQIMLSLSSGQRQILAQDTKKGDEGELQQTTVTVGRGSATEEVVKLQTVAPQFRGALVVCPGGNNPTVQLQIIQAVSALTGLGSDRISVCTGIQ